MFDFHMHSTVSFDGHSAPEEMVKAAVAAGLREVCFTDHLDYELGADRSLLTFTPETYSEAYDHLYAPELTIRKGVELGITPWNLQEVRHDLGLRHYDFVLGSIHFVDNIDPYFAPYWQGKTVPQAEMQYFEEILKCVQLHDDFDVLGHLTYISKTREHPAPRLIPVEEYRDIVAAIMEELIRKDKGMEVNTSGVGRVGDFLPGEQYLRLFKDLGGKIVTTGSDAHKADRVGQHIGRATEMLKDIFGYVCTFADRQPVFHKL